MVSLKIIVVLGAVFLLSSSFAKPRSPHSTRYFKTYDNSAGEFVLWSCTATAELQRNDLNKNIIHVVPVTKEQAVNEDSEIRSPQIHIRPSKLSSEEKDNDSVNNIQIIKVNTIPHHVRGKPEVVIKKTDETLKIKDLPPMSDSPLKTIKVNSFRKDTPLLFREKPQLPQVEYRPMNEDENDKHGSEIITVIRS